MKILVIGSWNPETAKSFLPEAQKLGYELAKRNHTLVASPSSGFQGLVAQAYKQNNGAEFIGYYPELKLMEEMGEETLVQPDTSIYTKQDYPMRNLLQIKGSDAVIGVTGGAGTLTELIASISDYKLPTAFFERSSYIVNEFRNIDNYFKKDLKYSKNIGELLDYLESKQK